MGGNAMQPLANITPLKPAQRAGAVQVSGVGQIYKTSGQDVVAVSDVSLEVKPGRFVVLVGPSGCGKSTLLMMMAGLRRQTSGTILISGAPIDVPDPNRVGVVFQEPSLFPWLTAEENVEFPLTLRGVAKKERRAKAEEALELVGLDGFGKRHPHELTGGMKQRVSIGPGLVAGPAGAADGRAFRGARRTDAHDHGRRAAADLGCDRQDGSLCHAQPDRGGLSRRRSRGDVGASGPHRRPVRCRAAAPAHLRNAEW